MRACFSNSLELQRRLTLMGADEKQLEPAFVQLERFQERFLDQCYQLMGEGQVDRRNLAMTLTEVTGKAVNGISFISCERQAQLNDEQPWGVRQAQQMTTYERMLSGPIQLLLETGEHRTFEGARPENSRRRMTDVIKGAIGTRRLMLALDNTFGNCVGSVLRHGIVAVWTTHFMSFVPKAGSKLANPERIASTKRLVEYLTQALPAFYLKRADGQGNDWTVFTA